MIFSGPVAGVAKLMVLSALLLSACAGVVRAQQDPYTGDQTAAVAAENGPDEPPITELESPVVQNLRADEDPYEALGVRAGSLILYPAIEAVGGYSNNANKSPTDPQSSRFISLLPSLKVQSDWSRHSLSVDLRGSYTTYTELDDENERTVEANAALDFDVTRKTQIGLSGGYELDDEDDNTDETYSAGIALTHRFNRLSASLRGETDIYRYSERSTSTGSVAEDNVADYDERRLGLRLSYELTDRLSLFTDGSVNERSFEQARDASGALRGSDGYEVTVGVEFAPTGKLRGDIAGGYLQQFPDEPSFGDISAAVFEANLTWLATGLTTVNLSASTDAAETTLASSPGYIGRQASVEVEHALRRNILLRALASYEILEFQDTDFDEETTEVSAGLEYLLSRSWALTAEASYLWYDSTAADADYEEARISAGVRWQR